MWRRWHRRSWRPHESKKKKIFLILKCNAESKNVPTSIAMQFLPSLAFVLPSPAVRYSVHKWGSRKSCTEQVFCEETFHPPFGFKWMKMCVRSIDDEAWAAVLTNLLSLDSSNSTAADYYNIIMYARGASNKILSELKLDKSGKASDGRHHTEQQFAASASPAILIHFFYVIHGNICTFIRIDICHSVPVSVHYFSGSIIVLVNGH